MKYIFIVFGVAAAAWLQLPAPAVESNRTDRLVIHEWGTFTVLQNEDGAAIPGVNINEESLPNFVHRLATGLAPDSPELGPLLSAGPYSGQFMRSKGVPRFYPAVTMRMETPIIYFHPAAGTKLPLTLDVGVRFQRGWISEWFPHAFNDSPGFKPDPNETFAGKLSRETVGEIRWEGLQVGVEATLPETKEHVWLAPRQVPAATVINREGEAERYLFYRGVANLEAPMRVVRGADQRLELSPNYAGLDLCSAKEALNIQSLWLADIRPDGRTAFREVAPVDLAAHKSSPPPRVSAKFDEKDYTLRSELRASMRRAIITAGLYEAEADALLNTWEASYFKSPGLRLFFLTPRAWTDAILPMSISQAADVERVMIGRIELVSPEQRDLLAKIAATPAADLKWFTEPFVRLPDQFSARSELLAGRRTLADYGIRMPDNYRWYLALGRFRDALVLDAMNREKINGLHAFAEAYGLRYFKNSL
jgi:hypothetical protein